ncbi:hypothetical protein [uncultured Psychrosphaera sp.]|uniref:hypothetical protein n=1 Tax=uncultured Psychrosphaera sp. TaxID=1403522 RepID=UPI0026274BA2|nr:hypothetical protein [uncultured Psychrosphaera sp.]
MSDKTKIVYVGKKSLKKDTITGSRLLFKPNVPVDVDANVALRLLQYPRVWVEVGQEEDALEQQQRIEDERIEAEKLAAAKKAQEELENSLVIYGANEEIIDLAKYNGAQVQTLAESEELTVEAQPKPVAEYKVAVRDAMYVKYGKPELTVPDADQE